LRRAILDGEEQFWMEKSNSGIEKSNSALRKAILDCEKQLRGAGPDEEG
jgi:hypothetical protein